MEELAIVLGRWQFAITTVYHYIFVPITIGITPILAFMHTMYYVTNNDKYRRMTMFFGKLFLINFALGLVTGITQEFQFGMNWSGYSRFVGDIFGAPLAMEALLAFFMESTFLGLWMFGWKHLSPKLHLLSIWMVALGTWLSALFILAANSFMQNPVGYIYNEEKGRLELDNFLEVLGNPVLPFMYGHVVTSALATAGILIAGVSAWHLLRNNQNELFKSALRIGLVVTLVMGTITMLIGHGQAQQIALRDPMKLAAIEAQWETKAPAPLSVFTIGDMDNRRNNVEIAVPGLLSFMAHDDFTTEVKGMNDLQEEAVAKHGPGNYIPNTLLTYWSFRAMILMGAILLIMSASGLWLTRGDRLNKVEKSGIVHLWLRVAVPCIVVGVLGNSFGWVLTEVGRQPWVVNGLMLTKDGISVAVGSTSVLITLVLFTLLYGVLAVAEFYLMWKYGSAGPEAPADLPGHVDGELAEEHEGKASGISATDRPISPVVNY